MRNIAIFWDFDNTHLTVQENFGSSDYIEKLVNKIFEKFASDKIRIFRAFADFEKIRKVQSDLQKRKVTPKHVFSSNSGSNNRKNASDIELCLDALEVAITNSEITDFVIITADKDMIPLLHKLTYYGKETHLFYLNEALADDQLILTFANHAESIEQLIGLVKFNAEELTEDYFNKTIPKVMEIAYNFFERNKGKPTIYLGKSFFRQEIINKLECSGDIADKLIGCCVENSLLTAEDMGNNKVKYTTKELVSVN